MVQIRAAGATRGWGGIAGNLHRADLSAVERAEHIEEWRKLTLQRGGQLVHPFGGKQPRDRGQLKTAEALGVSHDTVRRAEQIASLPDAIRDQARVEHIEEWRQLEVAENNQQLVGKPGRPTRGVKAGSRSSARSTSQNGRN